ncbi:unnamed protein product [Effrenium voratum]|uniref:Uncharacterized protein n=1 Tax=Effrenium voratum TaxID=2562239 RepID=A0AA36MNZ1_9DINO|nr:unnamed protein product [Effrenium voratum]CAJ1441332.1 unnamed protein product [Effrenium voratum]
MPPELFSQTGHATWQVGIERERAARLRLRSACRPLPVLRAEVERIEQREESKVSRSTGADERVKQVNPLRRAPTMWAGLSLAEHPQMTAHVFGPKLHPHGGASSASGSLSGLDLETCQRLTSSHFRLERSRSGPGTGTLPSHMLCYPQTGQWLL